MPGSLAFISSLHPWATWSSWRCPCLLQGYWARWPLKVPSNPNYSMNMVTFPIIPLR